MGQGSKHGWLGLLCQDLHTAIKEGLGKAGVSPKGLIVEESASKLHGCCQDSVH